MTRSHAGDGPHVYGYVRCSTESQADSGLGQAAQRTAIEGVAARLGLPIAHIYEDAGLSGSLGLEDRPGLLAVVSALHRGDVLVVAKRDRIARDVFLSLVIEREVKQRRARLVSAAGEGTADDDPASVFMRRILDAVSELERALISARTAAALRAKRLRGERVGNVPFGFKLAADGRRLVPQPDEQRVLARLRELRASGLTLRAVAERLNDEGYTTRRVGRWVYQYVAAQLHLDDTQPVIEANQPPGDDNGPSLLSPAERGK